MAVKKIGNIYDFQQIPIQGAVLETRSSAPTSPAPINGRLYYDTTLTRYQVRENGAWANMSQTGSELLANKGASNGYASLVSGTVPIAQIALGSSATTVCVGNDARLSDQRVPTDGSVTGGTAGGGVKIAAGTITLANLNASLLSQAAGVESLRQLGFLAANALAGTTRLDQIAIPTAPVNMNSQEVTNVGAPGGPNSAARLVDIQTAQAGIDNKPSVRFGSIVNLTLSGLTFDGGTRTDGDRVLLTGQSTGSQNGPWLLHSGAWTRPPNETITSGAFWLITEGTMAGQQWKVATPDPIVLDTTSLSITQWGQGQIYTGTTNRITVTGSVIDISSAYVGQATITTLGTITTGVWTGTAIALANGGTGGTSAATARANLVVPSIYKADLGAMTAGVELNVNHALNTTDTIESFKIVADGTKTDMTVRTIDANNIGVTTDVVGGYGAGAIRIVVVGG